MAQLKELAEREEAARAEELSKATVRTSSEAEAFRVSGRLYNEAEHRRRRQAEREEQRRQMESLQMASCSSIASRAEGETPRWEKLYASAPLKEKRLEDERRKAQEAEEMQMAENCIHRAPREPSGEAFQRLYRDGMNREQRLQRMRLEEEEHAARQLAEGSVHTARLSSAAAILEERTRRLYEDGMQRQERLQEAQRAARESTKVQTVARTSGGVSRFDLLYSDASRRDDDRKLWQEQHEKEELERYRQRSTSKPTPRKREMSTRKPADRLEGGSGYGEEPELPIAEQALIPTPEVQVGEMQVSPRLRPGRSTSLQKSKFESSEVLRRSGTPPRSAAEAMRRSPSMRKKLGEARSITPPPPRHTSPRHVDRPKSAGPCTPPHGAFAPGRTPEGCQRAANAVVAGGTSNSVQRAVSVDQLRSETPRKSRSSSKGSTLKPSPSQADGKSSRAQTPRVRATSPQAAKASESERSPAPLGKVRASPRTTPRSRATSRSPLRQA